VIDLLASPFETDLVTSLISVSSVVQGLNHFRVKLQLKHRFPWPYLDRVVNDTGIQPTMNEIVEANLPLASMLSFQQADLSALLGCGRKKTFYLSPIELAKPADKGQTASLHKTPDFGMEKAKLLAWAPQFSPLIDFWFALNLQSHELFVQLTLQGCDLREDRNATWYGRHSPMM